MLGKLKGFEILIEILPTYYLSDYIFRLVSRETYGIQGE